VPKPPLAFFPVPKKQLISPSDIEGRFCSGFDLSRNVQERRSCFRMASLIVVGLHKYSLISNIGLRLTTRLIRSRLKAKKLESGEVVKNLQSRIINFPKIVDFRETCLLLKGTSIFLLRYKRVFYLYDVPSGETRGGHAHKNTEQ